MPTYAYGCVLQSYDYKIKLEHVKRLYLLPEIDEKHMMFVVRDRPWPLEELGASKGKPRARSYRLSVSRFQVALDPPIRQGNTRYNFLVFRIPIDEEVDSLTVNLTEYGRALCDRGGAHLALRLIGCVTVFLCWRWRWPGRKSPPSTRARSSACTRRRRRTP